MRNRTQFRRHAVPPEPGIQPPLQARRFITIHHKFASTPAAAPVPKELRSKSRIQNQTHSHFRTLFPRAPYLHKPEYEFKTKPNSPESGFRFTIEGQCTASFCS